jgi:hypothetical protein
VIWIESKRQKHQIGIDIENVKNTEISNLCVQNEGTVLLSSMGLEK